MKRFKNKEIVNVIAIAFFSMISFVSMAQDRVLIDNLYYTVLSEEDKTAELSGYDSKIPIQSVTVPNTVNINGTDYSVIGIGYSNVFTHCKSLTSIELPETLKYIGHLAFWGCESLSSITLPDSLEKIELCAFFDCSSLVSINLPKSVKLANGVFFGCTSLVTFDVSEENPYYSTDGTILYNKDRSVLISYPSASDVIEISNQIKEIGKYAFAGCHELSQVTIPASVNEIEDLGFGDCWNLKTVIFLSETPPRVHYDPFANYNRGAYSSPLEDIIFYVPDSSLEIYKSKTYFKTRDVRPISEYTSVKKAVMSNYYTVYSLDGRFIMRTDNAEKLGSLDGGIYIINGEKVMIRNRR